MEERQRKVIYIMGTGRSGTTLLDIVLGNSSDCFSTGEIIKFPWLKARPHGFAENTENFKFWKYVDNKFKKKISIDYSYLTKVSKYIESHYRFLLNYVNIIDKEVEAIYRKYINSLFDSIYENILHTNKAIVDSSKYPGRALALSRYLKYQVYIVYIIRDPRGVVYSFSKKGIEQPPKNFFSANIYYFIINLFCNLVKNKISKNHILKIRYEDFITHPIKILSSIEDKFSLDLTIPKKKIENNEPLKVGFLFEGNRIRLKKNIFLEKKQFQFDKTLKNNLTMLINGFWYKKV